ncbi:MAG: type III pantothenate kinase [Clostridium sp.]|nr:type III pantothenate kinase [Clostridium sp.]MBQ4148522.1 type III pantothenate kinase [Clostridium sp.]MBQ5421406.1 type III pantothenate kinase [Clostridium sp.]HAE80223.1 type III pantothenate kinase [Lachnoclostridium sp.]
MILAVDIANTTISIGCIDAKQTYFWERITTVIGKPNLEYAISLKTILDIYGISPDSIEGAIISSVVPPLNRTLSEAIRKITGIRPRFVGSGIKTGLNIRMDNPKSVGSDMIVNAVGALREHEPPLVIVDTGTATTISVIDKGCNYIGGCILPGLRLSLDALCSGTAQLPKISLDPPKHVIGKNTEDSMRSGVICGHADMINGLLTRIEQELGCKPSIIATGGIFKLLLPYMNHPVIYDGTLLLKGLLELYKKNQS